MATLEGENVLGGDMGGEAAHIPRATKMKCALGERGATLLVDKKGRYVLNFFILLFHTESLRYDIVNLN